MSDPALPSEPTPVHYRLRVRGHLAPHWAALFDGLTITAADDGTTCLEGLVIDQSALYGLISRMRDLGLTLLEVRQVDPAPRA